MEQFLLGSYLDSKKLTMSCFHLLQKGESATNTTNLQIQNLLHALLKLCPPLLVLPIHKWDAECGPDPAP